MFHLNGTGVERDPAQAASWFARAAERGMVTAQTKLAQLYLAGDGVPADMFVMTFKMIQAPQEIVLLTELNSPSRQIYTDGRPLPKDPEPSWMGYSVGKWDGDTLVVETSGLNDRGWLDAFGHARSELMHITERYHRRDFGHMDLEFTFEDPKYYTRPFGLKTAVRLIPDSDLIEYVCSENEKDRSHLGK